MNKKLKLYAAYGSNMNLEQMARRCPNANVLCIGALNGYRLTFRGNGSGAGVANVEPAEGSSVPIVVWTITPRCEKVLDIYEGYPRLYIKETMKIETKLGAMNAMFYVMTKEYANRPVTPGGRYYGIIQRGYEDHEIDTMPLMENLHRASKEVLDYKRGITNNAFA